MPPRKRVLADTDANTQSQPPSKSQKVSEKEDNNNGKEASEDNGGDAEGSKENVENGEGSKKQESEKKSEHDKTMDDLENRPPYEYYCIPRLLDDLEAEDASKPRDQRLGEDEVFEKYRELSEGDVILKPAVEHPDHKWIAMWQTWKMWCDWKRRASYTDPDSFGMYVYNDFHGYGLQELIENFLDAINKELFKKNRDESSTKQLWATTAAMIYWIRTEQMGPWMGIDDGERFCKTIHLIGLALLETLNDLDHASLLLPSTSPNCKIPDLGLVISLYLDWAKDLEAYGVDEPEDLEWRKHAIGYVRKGGIDLVKEGCWGMEKTLKGLEGREGVYGVVRAVKDGKGKGTRWKWRKFFRDYTDEYHGVLPAGMGGESFNILKMDREERAGYAFKKKDPLAAISDKDLEEGNIMIR